MAVFVLSSFFSGVEAKVTLPRIIADGMVLQRGDSIPLWGKADAGEQVVVKFLKKTYKTQADADGNWRLQLPPRKAGGPYVMNIGDCELKNVYVGDVWLTSGQSNIDVHIDRVRPVYTEEAATTNIPQVHLIQLDRSIIPDGPQEDIGAGSYAWQSLEPSVVGHWSALSYFFAKEMWEHTGVPQGIVNASLGGSNIIAWLDRKTVGEIDPRYIAQLDHLLQPGYLSRNAEINRAIGEVYNRVYESNDPGLLEQWMKPEYDDSSWETVNQFASNIGDENGRTWKGSLWFRKTFDVPDSLAGREATLRLGYMIDSDESYLNGEKVGSTGYEYPPRIYKIRQGLTLAGKNTVCIRLKTNGSSMKFKTDKPYKLIVGDTEISLEGDYKMKRGVLMPGQPGVEGVNNGVATTLWNGMIAPIRQLKFSGIIWYQGETNAGNPKEYSRFLPALVRQWRGHFGQVPMIICSLANYMERHAEPAQSSWAEMRDVQRRVCDQFERVGFACMADLGEWNDIHPLHKKDAAHRCALQARKLYLKESLVAEGPAYESVKFEGNKAIISFRQGTGRLVAKRVDPRQTAAFVAPETLPDDPDGRLVGFAVAGADGKFYNAEARIVGAQVEVWSSRVAEPKEVRYGWDDDPILTLYNEMSLPAAPFGTK